MSNHTTYLHADITGKIIEAGYYVHQYFGFGHVESIYENSMLIKLRKMGFQVEKQVPIKVYFEGELVGNFKADLVINDTIIVELKAISELHSKHEVQLVNYLKSTTIEVGLLMNFGEELKIKRRVLSNEKKRKEGRIP